MNHISDKKYIRLFTVLLKLNPNLNLFNLSSEEQEYVSNIAYLIDFFSNKDTFGYTYNIENGKVISQQVLSAISFIHTDFAGIISDISSIKDISREELVLHSISDLLGEDVIADYGFVNNLALIVYLREESQVHSYSEIKKYATKQKISEQLDLEGMKKYWKKTVPFIDYCYNKKR